VAHRQRVVDRHALLEDHLVDRFGLLRLGETLRERGSDQLGPGDTGDLDGGLVDVGDYPLRADRHRRVQARQERPYLTVAVRQESFTDRSPTRGSAVKVGMSGLVVAPLSRGERRSSDTNHNMDTMRVLVMWLPTAWGLGPVRMLATPARPPRPQRLSSGQASHPESNQGPPACNLAAWLAVVLIPLLVFLPGVLYSLNRQRVDGERDTNGRCTTDRGTRSPE
jgi:hypothetical protein